MAGWERESERKSYLTGRLHCPIKRAVETFLCCHSARRGSNLNLKGRLKRQGLSLHRIEWTPYTDKGPPSELDLEKILTENAGLEKQQRKTIQIVLPACGRKTKGREQKLCHNY